MHAESKSAIIMFFNKIKNANDLLTSIIMLKLFRSPQQNI